jgi:hypothetical protein
LLSTDFQSPHKQALRTARRPKPASGLLSLRSSDLRTVLQTRLSLRNPSPHGSGRADQPKLPRRFYRSDFLAMRHLRGTVSLENPLVLPSFRPKISPGDSHNYTTYVARNCFWASSAGWAVSQSSPRSAAPRCGQIGGLVWVKTAFDVDQGVIFHSLLVSSPAAMRARECVT